jgi:hypothetical protein
MPAGSTAFHQDRRLICAHIFAHHAPAPALVTPLTLFVPFWGRICQQ